MAKTEHLCKIYKNTVFGGERTLSLLENQSNIGAFLPLPFQHYFGGNVVRAGKIHIWLTGKGRSKTVFIHTMTVFKKDTKEPLND